MDTMYFELTVTREMFINFFDTFFTSWVNNDEDTKKAANEGFLKILPKNVMWEIKPLAEKQWGKIKKVIETGNQKQFTEIFDKFASTLANEYWGGDLNEVNNTDIPNFAFCQITFGNLENKDFATFSRLLLGEATNVFNLDPDPRVE